MHNMPPVRLRGDGRKAKNPKKTLLRLLGYMRKYIPRLVIVLLCIIVAAMAQTTGSENIGTLVDDYILPMVANGSTDFGPLIQYLLGIAGIFAAGMLASFLIMLLPNFSCKVWLTEAFALFFFSVSFLTKADIYPWLFCDTPYQD